MAAADTALLLMGCPKVSKIRAAGAIKKADLSEGLATLSLFIKIGQYIAESAGYKAQYAAAFDFASFASMFLFGVSLVLWLRSSRKELEKVQGIADRLEEIKGESTS